MNANLTSAVLWASLASTALLLVEPIAAASTTTVTTYTYNADGAPTSVTTQVDDGAASTVYLSWDNFVPDAGDAASGTVVAGNGNLAAVGSEPSSSAPTYSFDRRDRLVGYSSGAQQLTYAYHPDGTMASSTTDDGDGLSFYYGGGHLPQISNMRQQSADLWSARLGRVRHLSDGTDQVLMKPRKDVAAEYDASAESLAAYAYDAFGACGCEASCSCAEAASSYDIRDNPFRYAGEYRDAIWQGQYLRARWYDAQVPSFVSRDPLAHLNRYGYGDANPVMMTDPAGMKASFWKELRKGFDKAIDWLDSGVQGHFSRLFLSPVLYPLEIVAHPVRFWNQAIHDPVQIAFIGVSAAAGALGGLTGASLATLELRQTGIGLAQSVFAGFDDLKSKHFDANAFLQSAESAVGASLAPALAGVAGGIRTREEFDYNVGAVHNSRAQLADGEFMILRGRQAHASGMNYSNPFLERARLGAYNEVVVAVSKDEVLATGFVDGKAVLDRGLTQADRSVHTLHAKLSNLSTRSFGDAGSFEFQFVGTISDIDRSAFRSNPLNLPVHGDVSTAAQRFNAMVNNSHTYSRSILRTVRQRN